MAEKPSYEELEQRVKELENGALAPKRSEEVIQLSAERFHRLFEQASDAFFIHDFNNGKIVDANESACKHLGYTRDELLELDVSDIEIGDSPEAIVENCNKVKEGGTVIVEGIHRRKDGSTFPVEISLGMLQDENPALLLAIARDTTERKKAKEALQESEEKQRGLIEGLDDAIYRMSLPDGEYEYMSPAAWKVFGVSAEEFMENPLIIGKLIHPDFAEYFKEKWANLIEHKVSPTYKYKILDPEGNERWIVQSNTGIFDDSGNIIAIEGLCRDITKEVQAEKALRESEELHKEAQRVAHIGHWELDPEIGTPVWSDEIFRIFGLIPQEGEPSFTDHETHLHPDDWPLLNKAVTLASAEGTPFDIIFRIVRPDGEIRWMHSIGTTSKDEKDRVLKLFGTAQDITDRKRAEKILRDGEERLSIALQGSNSGIWDWYIKTGKVFFDDNYFKISGYVPNEFPHSYEEWKKRVHTDDIEKAERKIRSYITGKTKVYSAEFRFRTKTNDWMWIHSQGKIFEYDDHGNPVRFTGTHLDITERKKAAEALRESQEKYRTLFNNAQVALFRTSISDGKLLQINKRYAKMAGYSNVEDCMAEFNAADAWANPSARDELLRILKENGSVNDFETEIIRRNGSRIWILFSATIFPKQGFLEGSIVDINERKQAEEALLKSEERFRYVLNNSIPVIYNFNLNTGTYDYLSPSVEKIYGYSAEEFIDGGLKQTLSKFHPDDLDKMDNHLEKLLAKKLEDFSPTVEYRFKHPELGYRWMSDTRTVIFDNNGKPISLVGNAYDITERKQAEKSLLESEKKLRIQNQIANIFLTKSDEDMYGEILSIVLDIMESKFGVFGYIDEQGDLVCPSMTRDIWDQCQISDKTIVFPENTWGESIWGNGLRTGLSAYSNKPFKVPEGHVPVDRCLTAPITYQRKSIGLLTVANKSNDYTEPDKQLLEEIAEHVAPVLNARIEKERSDKALREKAHNLNERVKELHCLHGISEIIERDLPFEEMFQEIVNHIPPAWQYPEAACARILINGQSFTSSNFNTSVWNQACDITVHGERTGVLEVYYLKQIPDMDEGPFLKEERDLIISIAESLGKVMERTVTEGEKLKLEAQLQQAQKMEAIGGPLQAASPMTLTTCSWPSRDVPLWC